MQPEDRNLEHFSQNQPDYANKSERIGPDITPIRYIDGLPVISHADMGKLMSLRANEYQEKTVCANFRGYYYRTDGSLIYRELVIANRILGEAKDPYKGVNVAIWGVNIPGKLTSNIDMRSPEDCKGYVAQFMVSSGLKTAAQKLEAPEDRAAYYKDFQLNLMPDSQGESLGKITKLIYRVVSFIEEGGDLDKVESLILELDKSLGKTRPAIGPQPEI